MVTCQSSELGWEVTVVLLVDFLSLGRGSVKLVSEHKYTITEDLRRSDTMSIWYQSISIQ